MDIHVVAINKAKKVIATLSEDRIRDILSEVYPAWTQAWDDPRKALEGTLYEDPEFFALPILKRLGIRPKVYQQKDDEPERLEKLSDGDWARVA